MAWTAGRALQNENMVTAKIIAARTEELQSMPWPEIGGSFCRASFAIWLMRDCQPLQLGL